MSEMVERVARAISENVRPDRTVDDAARAAIAAMRAPTEAPVTTMVERVARAMYAAAAEAAATQDEYPGWNADLYYVRASFVINARAAIAAMREPTAGMLREGLYHASVGYDAGVIYSAMVQQALSPHPAFDEP